MSTIIRFNPNGHITGPKMKSIEHKPDTISLSGVPINLPDIKAKEIGKGNLGLHVDVTYRKSVRSFDLIGENVKLHKFSGEWEETGKRGLAAPVYDPNGGNANAYWIMGRAWPATAKKVTMSLKDDAYLAGTGMSKSGALAAVASAENTWNNATNQKPFSGTSALTTTANWKYDGINNIAFTPYAVGCTALAATGVWYKTQGIPSGQMYPIVESDMTINSNLKWTTTGETGKLDFQSVILHELGHTIGLGDLYNKVAFKTDTRQVMHYYTGVKRTLGNGDSNGVWHLYG